MYIEELSFSPYILSNAIASHTHKNHNFSDKGERIREQLDE